MSRARDLSACRAALSGATDAELVEIARVIEEERASRKDEPSGAPPTANRRQGSRRDVGNRDGFRPAIWDMPTINWDEAKRELDAGAHATSSDADRGDNGPERVQDVEIGGVESRKWQELAAQSRPRTGALTVNRRDVGNRDGFRPAMWEMPTSDSVR